MSAGQRYRAATLEVVPAGGGKLLAWPRGRGGPVALDARDADVLVACDAFRGLPEHAAAAEERGLGDRSQLAGLLEGLVRDRLLVGMDEVADSLRARAGQQAGFDEFAVVTCDRPEMLGRALASLSGPAARPPSGAAWPPSPASPRGPASPSGPARASDPTARESDPADHAPSDPADHAPSDPADRASWPRPIVVVDDSRSDRSRVANREVIAEATASGAPLRYAGAAEKRAFAALLTKESGAPAELVEFLLLGDLGDVGGHGDHGDRRPGTSTVGANRNALLLDTVGKAFVSIDDDIVWQPRTVPGTQPGVSLNAHGDPVQRWFASSHEEALGLAPLAGDDLAALHDDWLGADIAAALAADPSTLLGALDSAGSEWLGDLASTEAEPVAVTVAGTVGDCGWDNPDYHLFQQGASLARLVSSPDYEALRRARHVVQGVDRVTVSYRADQIMAGSLGVDNRRAMPPFPPIGRAEEVGFGTALSICEPRWRAVHLPRAVVHDPPGQRGWERASPPLAIGFNAWLPSVMTAFGRGNANSPEGRLRHLGRSLQDLGSLDAESFADLARRHVLHAVASLCQSLERAAAAWQDSSPRFALEAHDCVARVRARAADPVEDLCDSGDLDLLRQQLRGFGHALTWWPAIRQAAAGLVDQGHRLSVAVKPGQG